MKAKAPTALEKLSKKKVEIDKLYKGEMRSLLPIACQDFA
jgi:hypothetical protein